MPRTCSLYISLAVRILCLPSDARSDCRHYSLEHNKRAALAYLKHRLDHVLELRWSLGTAVVPPQLEVNSRCALFSVYLPCCERACSVCSGAHSLMVCGASRTG